MRVNCPPHRFACHYGIDFPDPEKLIANQMSMEDICKYLGVDSLGYLDVEGMVRATGKPLNSFCLACFNGDYPLPVDPALDKFIMTERTTNSAGKGLTSIALSMLPAQQRPCLRCLRPNAR